MNMFKEAAERAIAIYRANKDKDKVARFLSAEFPLVAYVSRGKVWTSGLDAQGKQQSQVVFI